MSTCPIPCLESSPTPSHMPKTNARKTSFSKQKLFVLENTLPSFGNYIGLPSEANCWIIFLEQSWVRLREELSDHSPRQFFGKSSLKFLSQPFFTFLFIFVSCTQTYHLRVPRCIWNALRHFQTIDANIFYMYILTKINSHTNHIIHVIQFTINNTKISSHGLITNLNNSF